MVHYTSEIGDSNNQEVRALLCNLLENNPPYKKIRFDNEWYYKLITLDELSVRSFCESCDTESVFCAALSCTFKEIVTACMAATANIFDATSSEKYKYFDGKSFSCRLHFCAPNAKDLIIILF